MVVITGASAGVGRAVARLFAEKKARIALLARGIKGLESTKKDVISRGGDALVIKTDVADADQVEAAAAQVMSEWGRIDKWINCAMVTVYSEFSEMTTQEFHRVTEVNYLGYVYGTHAALKQMLPANKGTIIQVGSSLAYRGIPVQSAYCGSKHAIKGFTESLRCELLHKRSNVRITMVQLPALNTPQFSWAKNNMPKKCQPIKPVYQPEVAAEAIYWAAYHKRRETIVGTTSLVAIWAEKLFPGIVDRYLVKTAYEAQQYDGENDLHKKSNLWEPVDETEDFGAHGDFDEGARNHSGQWIVSTMPGYLFYGVLTLTLGAGWLIRRALSQK